MKVEFFRKDGKRFSTQEAKIDANNLPDVIVWGDAVFARLDPTNPNAEYIQCHSYRLFVSSEEGPSITPRTLGLST